MTFSQQQGAVTNSKVSPWIDTNWMYMKAKDTKLSEHDIDSLLFKEGKDNSIKEYCFGVIKKPGTALTRESIVSAI